MLLGFFIFILITVTILAIFAGNYLWQKKELKESMKNFSMLIESGNFDNLSLMIYYVSPSRDTPYAYGVDDVIKFGGQIVIDGNDLKNHIDLLNKISNVNLVPVTKKYDLNARIYYVFENEENGKIFDIVMWGYREDGKSISIFINGIAVKPNDVFYDVIMPFLPESRAEQLEKFK